MVFNYPTPPITNVTGFLQQLPSNKGDGIFDFRMIYRGQSSDLPLFPKLLRGFQTKTFDGQLSIPLQSDQIYSIQKREETLLMEFQRQAIPLLKDVPQPTSLLEWLAIGQHHGLTTRLLDWSESPLTALFFAVSDISDQARNEAGVVRIIHAQVVAQEFHSFEEINAYVEASKGIFIYRPRHLNARLVAQQGCFTVHQVNDIFMRSLEEQAEQGSEKILIRNKLLISSSHKRDILRELDRLGINHLSVFPDLDGLSKKLNTQDYLKRFT